MDSYKTLGQYTAEEYIVKKSRFIGYAKPVKTEQDAVSFIEEIRKKHWDATHNVYAYAIKEGSIKRFSDDGEPQGTAGMPVLNVITQEGITDCVVVVTRYFGGVLLGGGGLVRAYSHTAKLAVDGAEIVELVPWVVYETSCDYNLYGKLEALVRDMGGVCIDTVFTDNVFVTFKIDRTAENAFMKKLSDSTNGKVTCRFIEEIIGAK